MAVDRLETLLRDAFPDAAELRVEDRTGGGDHFQVTSTSPRFDGLPLLDQHRLVNDALAEPLARRHHPRNANQDEGDDMSELRERIKGVIENEPVALFMKGTPQFVMCGNSGPRAPGAAGGGRAGDGGRRPPRPGDPAGAVGRCRAGRRSRRCSSAASSSAAPTSRRSWPRAASCGDARGEARRRTTATAPRSASSTCSAGHASNSRSE